MKNRRKPCRYIILAFAVFLLYNTMENVLGPGPQDVHCPVQFEEGDVTVWLIRTRTAELQGL